MNYILDLSWKTPEELTALVDALRPYVYKELERMRLEKSCGNPEPKGLITILELTMRPKINDG